MCQSSGYTLCQGICRFVDAGDAVLLRSVILGWWDPPTGSYT